MKIYQGPGTSIEAWSRGPGRKLAVVIVDGGAQLPIFISPDNAKRLIDEIRKAIKESEAGK